MIGTFLLSPDHTGRVDATLTRNLFNRIPDLVTSQSQSDVTIVPISFYPDYRFNHELYNLRGKYVLVDFMEYGWNFKGSHLFGKSELPPQIITGEWQRFDDWVREHPPALTFKRELLQKDASDNCKPTEWPCYLGQPPLTDKGGFDSRAIEVFYNWGYSNPVRPKLHSDIFNGLNNGIDIVSEWDHLQPYLNVPHSVRTWVTIYSPYYVRRKMQDIMPWQEQSKISVSLPGAGQKCFRSTEAPVSSIMALQEDEYAWSMPWIDGENCIRLKVGSEFESLNEATRRSDLFDIYLASQETIDRYRPTRYINDYLLPSIKSIL